LEAVDSMSPSSEPSPHQEPTAELPRGDGPEAHGAVRCSVITVADELTLEGDAWGRAVDARLTAAGCRVVERTVVPMNPAPLGFVVRHWIAADVEVIVILADTWSSSGATTVDIVQRFLDRELPGFGQIFAALAFEEIGAPAIGYPVLAGRANGRLLLLLPSVDWALRLALDKILLPSLDGLLRTIGVVRERDS
jgi:molybdenum cofactor biosynthesis protein B